MKRLSKLVEEIERNIIKESIAEEVLGLEAVTPQGLDKILQKYAGQYKTANPQAYNDFLRHALTVLSKNTNLNDKSFDSQLGKGFTAGTHPSGAPVSPDAKMKAAAEPTQDKGPGMMQKAKQGTQQALQKGKDTIQKGKDWWKDQQKQRAGQKLVKSLDKTLPKPGQSSSPPPPSKGPGDDDFKPQPIPSLSSLAKSATDDKIEKPKASGGLPDLPDIEPQKKEKEPDFGASEPKNDKEDKPKKAPANKDKEEDDGEEVDVKSLGTVKGPKSKEKKAASAPKEPSKSKEKGDKKMPKLGDVAQGKEDKEEEKPEKKSSEKMPSLSAVAKDTNKDSKEDDKEDGDSSPKPPAVDIPSLYRAGMKAHQNNSSWKVGDTVSMGQAGKFKVYDKVGNRWYMQGNGPDQNYVFVPGKGMTKIKKKQ